MQNDSYSDGFARAFPLAESETSLLVTTAPTDTDPIVVVSAVGGSLSAQLALLRHEARRLALTLIDASQQTEEDR
jgi:hypothetical protein